jgi:LysR family transcriptional regulator, hydrogen peroxide-inducible genes activator
MNIQQLEYIVAVDRLKNFTRAADACFVTQATLSAMVKKLEEELGLLIFDRKSNPPVTTDAGKIIVEDAQKVLMHLRVLTERVNEMQGKIAGKIRIGIIPTVANSLLPRVLRGLMKAYPDLEFDITERTTENILRSLKEGIIDAGILATPIAGDPVEKRVLYYEALMVYGDSDTNKKYLLPKDVQNQQVWLLEEGHCLREQFLNLCSLKKKLHAPKNLKLEASSFETLLNLVDEFGGLTLIPELYYQSLPASRKEKVISFADPMPVREISMVYVRPFAKMRAVDAISNMIEHLIAKDLKAVNYTKDKMHVASF